MMNYGTAKNLKRKAKSNNSKLKTYLAYSVQRLADSSLVSHIALKKLGFRCRGTMNCALFCNSQTVGSDLVKTGNACPTVLH